MSKLPGKMTRKQHWVPRFYLRHFADSSGQLHAYSRQKGSFFRTNCENICSMRDLYEVEHADATGDATDRFYAQNLIEVKLSELESRIAPLYDRFLERQKEDQCEDEGYSDGKAAVCELAANIIVRHPISMRVDKKWSRETAEAGIPKRWSSLPPPQPCSSPTMILCQLTVFERLFLRRASPSLGHPSAQGSLRRRCLCSSSGPRTTRTIFISRICR